MFLSRRRARIDPINTAGTLRRLPSHSPKRNGSHLLVKSPSARAVNLNLDDEDGEDEDETAVALSEAPIAAPAAAPIAATDEDVAAPSASRPRMRSSLLARFREPPAEYWAAFTHEGGQGGLGKENQDTWLCMRLRYVSRSRSLDLWVPWLPPCSPAC